MQWRAVFVRVRGSGGKLGSELTAASSESKDEAWGNVGAHAGGKRGEQVKSKSSPAAFRRVPPQAPAIRSSSSFGRDKRLGPVGIELPAAKRGQLKGRAAGTGDERGGFGCSNAASTTPQGARRPGSYLEGPWHVFLTGQGRERDVVGGERIGWSKGGDAQIFLRLDLEPPPRTPPVAVGGLWSTLPPLSIPEQPQQHRSTATATATPAALAPPTRPRLPPPPARSRFYRPT